MSQNLKNGQTTQTSNVKTARLLWVNVLIKNESSNICGTGGWRVNHHNKCYVDASEPTNNPGIVNNWIRYVWITLSTPSAQFSETHLTLLQISNLNFHPLEVVSAGCDSQRQVSTNYSYMTKWSSTILKFRLFISRFTFIWPETDI